MQVLQNRAARVITGVRYDNRITSSDLLQSLRWDTLHNGWLKLKSVPVYICIKPSMKIILLFKGIVVKCRDLDRGYKIRSNETDLALPKTKNKFPDAMF